MPSFSTISIFATLAFAAFTAAVPTAASVPAVDLQVRVDRVEPSVLQNLTAAMNGVSLDTTNVANMTTELNNLATAVKSTNDYIKAKPSDALKGLSADDCVDGLGAIITIISTLLTIVTGLIQGGTLDGSDCDVLSGIITTVLNLLGELICLVVSLVPVLSLTSSLLDIIGGLLGGSGGLVSGLLNTVLTLVLGLIAPILSSILGALGPVISSCGLGDLLGIFGCQGSYPTACGGTLDILQFATSLLGTLLPLLLGAL